MAQSLDEFIIKAKNDLLQFEKDYSEKNKQNPEMYPYVMDDGNEGLWWEFLMDHD